MRWLIVAMILAIGLWWGTLEGFRFCANCGYYNPMSCLNCVNCGICHTPAGSAQCLPGDQNGPYFRADCVDWNYGITSNPWIQTFPWWGRYRHRRSSRHRGDKRHNK